MKIVSKNQSITNLNKSAIHRRNKAKKLKSKKQSRKINDTLRIKQLAMFFLIFAI